MTTLNSAGYWNINRSTWKQRYCKCTNVSPLTLTHDASLWSVLPRIWTLPLLQLEGKTSVFVRCRSSYHYGTARWYSREKHCVIETEIERLHNTRVSSHTHTKNKRRKKKTSRSLDSHGTDQSLSRRVLTSGDVTASLLVERMIGSLPLALGKVFCGIFCLY